MKRQANRQKDEGEPPQKKSKIIEEITNLKLTPNKLSVLLKFVKKLKSEKKDGFSAINDEKDVKRVFGKTTDFLKQWKITIPDSFEETITKLAKKIKKNYISLSINSRGKKEATDIEYISIFVHKIVHHLNEIEFKKEEDEQNQFIYEREADIEGNEAKGPVDYLIYRMKSEECLIIIEAKKDNTFSKGIPQLLMQLKAKQEEDENEGKEVNKWYCGFAATRKSWQPCRVNMKNEKGKQVEIGEEVNISKNRLDTYQDVVYLLKGLLTKTINKN